MKFPSYGLIISLSIFLCSSTTYSIDNVTPEAETKPQNSNALNNDLKATTDKLSNQINSFSTQFAVSTSAISNQLYEVNQKQKDIMLRLESISAQYDSSKSTSSPYESKIATLKKEQEDIVSLLMKLNENQEQLKDKIIALSVNSKPDLTKNNVSFSTGTKKPGLVPAQASIEDRSGQQYIKLKLMEDGQEIELFLDPTYVDMDFALPKSGKGDKSSKSISGSGKNDNENIDKIMQYASSLMDKKTSPNPQSETNPKNITENNNTLSDTEAQDLASKQSDDSQSLDDLLKSQKYFYEKNYIAALNAVQRSLAKQETALAYAIQGSIYYTIDDLDLATASWESALRLNPNMIEVKRALYKFRR